MAKRKMSTVEKKDRMVMKMMRMKCMSMAFGMVILGALVLANAYWTLLTWPMFIGWVLILAGLWKLISHKSCMM